MRAAAAAALPLLLVAGLTEDVSHPRVDERAGSYRGVRFGMSAAAARRLLGEPGRGSGFLPLGTTFAEIGGAPSVRVWPPSSRARPTVLRYDGVAFLAGERGVFALVVAERGARTRRGVAVGEPLARARAEYRLGCVTASAGEPPARYPSCRGTIGGRI